MINKNEMPRFSGEVLLCEDNEINQHVIKTHLTKLGLDIVIANDGKEGVDLVNARINSGGKPFDLIFMDIQMPVMDGLQASDAMASLGNKTPVVALTANTESEDRELYAAHGMTRSLNKPFSTEELWACLYEYFAPLSHETVRAEAQASEEEKQRVKLFTSFVRRNQNTYGDICQALGAGDVKTAHRLAHTLRGLAGLMGKAALQEAARVVEHALAGGDASKLEQDCLAAMGEELSSVLTELAPYLEEKPDTAPLEFNKDKARELFGRLQALLREDDAESVKLTDELRAFPGTGPLIALLDDYEFESALETLEGLKRTLEV